MPPIPHRAPAAAGGLRAFARDPRALVVLAAAAFGALYLRNRGGGTSDPGTPLPVSQDSLGGFGDLAGLDLTNPPPTDNGAGGGDPGAPPPTPDPEPDPPPPRQRVRHRGGARTHLPKKHQHRVRVHRRALAKPAPKKKVHKARRAPKHATIAHAPATPRPARSSARDRVTTLLGGARVHVKAKAKTARHRMPQAQRKATPKLDPRQTRLASAGLHGETRRHAAPRQIRRASRATLPASISGALRGLHRPPQTEPRREQVRAIAAKRPRRRRQ